MFWNILMFKCERNSYYISDQISNWTENLIIKFCRFSENPYCPCDVIFLLHDALIWHLKLTHTVFQKKKAKTESCMSTNYISTEKKKTNQVVQNTKKWFHSRYLCYKYSVSIKDYFCGSHNAYGVFWYNKSLILDSIHFILSDSN